MIRDVSGPPPPEETMRANLPLYEERGGGLAIVPCLTGPQFHLSFNGLGKPPNQGDNRGKADHEGNGAAFLCGHLRGPSLLRPRVLAEAGMRPEGSHLFPVKLDAPELAGLKVGVVHAFKDD